MTRSSSDRSASWCAQMPELRNTPCSKTMRLARSARHDVDPSSVVHLDVLVLDVGRQDESRLSDLVCRGRRTRNETSLCRPTGRQRRPGPESRNTGGAPDAIAERSLRAPCRNALGAARHALLRVSAELPTTTRVTLGPMPHNTS